MEYVDGSNLRRHIGERGALTVGEALRDRRERARRARRGPPRRPGAPRHQARERAARHRRPRQARRLRSRARGHRGHRRRPPAPCSARSPTSPPSSSCAASSDARTDVYACGILLFEMLTGRQPFTGETPIQVAFQHVNNDIPAPSDAGRTGCPSRSTTLVARARRARPRRPAGRRRRRARAAAPHAGRARRGDARRRADVAPSIVLPAATDPDETDLDAEPAEADESTRRARRPASPGDRSRPGRDHAARDRRRAAAPRSPCPSASVSPRPSCRGRPRTSPRRAGATVRAGSSCSRCSPRSSAAGAWWYLAAGPGRVHDRPDDRRPGRGRTPTAILAHAGLGAKPTSDFDGTAPKGEVVQGRARPGRADPQGRHGRRSRSPRARTTSQVPDGVVGAMQADAEAALRDADLDAASTPTRPPATTAATGQGPQRDAARTAPPPSRARRPSAAPRVTLTVSNGPAPVTITSVVGATLEDATAAARRRDALTLAADRGVQRHRAGRA